jgi:hypothetical protein
MQKNTRNSLYNIDLYPPRWGFADPVIFASRILSHLIVNSRGQPLFYF